MPYPQPAPENPAPDRTRQGEAAALALLLLGARKRYDLPGLIAAQGIRPRPFRQIRPTNALASDMSAPHFAIVRAWADVVPRIAGQSASAIEQASSYIAATVGQAKAQFPRILSRFEAYHRAQWTSRVRASTGLDVSMFTGVQDVTETTDAIAAWNRALADDEHAQIRSRLTAELAGNLDADAAMALAKEVIAKAKKRAAGIGSDQAARTIAGMNRDRREAAGITSYRWNHSPHVLRPRPHHLARDGKVFLNDEIAADDRCGAPYGCQCWEQPVL